MAARLFAVLLMLLASACSTTANINRFKSFAELGRTYESAVLKVIDQAAETNIDANSQELINARELSSATADREMRIQQMNERVAATTATLMRLKRQISLLSDYFTALGALASFDGDSAVGQSAGNVVTALQGLSPSLENARIGNAAPADLIGGAVSLVVSGVRSRRLSEELRRHGAVIDRQLALQTALLEALADNIRADQTILSERRMLDETFAPYVAAGALPGNWATRRRELILQAARATAPAEEAVVLSRRMRLAFVALSEGRMEPGELAVYAADLGRLVSLIEQVAGPAD